MKLVRLALAFLLIAGMAHAADTAAPPAAAPDANTQALIGTWDREENVPNTGLVNSEMTFEQDGTFHGRVQVQDHVIWQFAGKWQLKDGAILYNYTESSRKDIPVGTQDTDRIISITPAKLTIQSATGEEIYLRMDAKKEQDLYLGPR